MFSANTIDIHSQLTSELNTSDGNFKHLKEYEENILIETRKSRKHSMAIIILVYYVGAIPSMSG